MTNPIKQVNTLTFDIFGTVLDLAGSLIPPLNQLLKKCAAPENITGDDVWAIWRQRQRIEQYQDNLLMLGHSGYLPVKRRALLYTLRTLKINFTYEQIDEFMDAYNFLSPFKDAIDGLNQLSEKFNLVKIKTTFQSRFGPQEWLQPYTDKTLENLPKEGIKNVLTICPGFSSDCVETLEEILIQGKESFINAGGTNFDMVPCLNDNDDHIFLIKSLIENNL